MMHVLKEADAIAMGLSLTEAYGNLTQMTTAFPEEANRNAALTLTSRGINNILGQLRRRGALKGVIPSSSKEAAVNWQWEVLTIHVPSCLSGNPFTLHKHPPRRCERLRSGL